MICSCGGVVPIRNIIKCGVFRHDISFDLMRARRLPAVMVVAVKRGSLVG